LNELEAAAPPDAGPTLVIEHYEHEFTTVEQAVAVSEVVLIGEIVDEEAGEWREVAGRRERDRFLVVSIEDVLLGDIAEPRIRLRELGDMLQDGLLRERREGGGALQLRPGDRVLLMALADPASGAYVKVNVDAIQLLQDGEVGDSQRDTAFSQAAETWSEQELVERFEAAISAREG
jgi:hypothetical protein